MDNSHTVLLAASGLLVGFATSAGICSLIVRSWRFETLGWDKGDVVRKEQKRPILRLGGLGVAASLLVLFVLWSFAVPTLPGRAVDPKLLIIICFLFFLVGLADDFYGVPASIKLLAHFSIAGLAYWFGFRIGLLSSPFGSASLDLGALSLPMTIAWIIAIPNLINLTDGMDGLAGGISIALIGTLAIVSWVGGDMVSAILSIGMIGGVVGFLFYNVPKARLYLGDGGAYLIGAFIACISISSSQKGPIAGTLLVVIIALALPIADASFAVLRRFFYGFPIWQADREHIHHRLVTLGIRRGLVIGILISTVVVLSALGFLLLFDAKRSWPVVITTLLGGGVVLLRKLGYWGSFRAFLIHIRRIRLTRRKVRYACALGIVLEHELDWALSAREFWVDFHHSLSKAGLYPCGAATVFASEMERLEVPLADGRVWSLAYRKEYEEMHWGKVAACFLGPLSRGIAKWGDPPSDLGVIQVTSGIPGSSDLPVMRKMPG